MSKTKKSFEIDGILVDIPERYFITGDTVLIDYGLPCMKLEGVVEDLVNTKKFQRLVIRLNEPVTIIHEGNKFKNEIKNSRIRRSKKVG